MQDHLTEPFGQAAKEIAFTHRRCSIINREGAFLRVEVLLCSFGALDDVAEGGNVYWIRDQGLIAVIVNPPSKLSTRHGRVVRNLFGSAPVKSLRQALDVESAFEEQRGSFVDLKAIRVEWKVAVPEASIFSRHEVFSAVTLRIA